jgi:hypothetical protein
MNREAMKVALKDIVNYLDYDLAKSLDGIETGEDTWSEVYDRFADTYQDALLNILQGRPAEAEPVWHDSLENPE